MPKINILPAHLADLIAAGEVVERPASAVKELMENAIDAGATAMTVEIQNGGLTYIRVTDNGCGMSSEDASRAFLRHATSKISRQTDLEAIGTLGFRGEALAAIAAVSHTELMTRTHDGEGVSMALDAGKVTASAPAGCPEGTTIIVRDLFFNTPARLKFMKKDSFEAAAVHQAVVRIALSHPEISIKYLRDGKQELMTPGDSNLINCIYNTLGRDVALGLLPVRWQDEETEVQGFVARPTACRGSRAGQYFFVNGRHIKSAGMTGSLEAAYKNRMMVGRFPVCVLNVTVKLASVDVNVHPAKTEVKFFAEKRVYDAVYRAACDALDNERRVEPEPKAAPVSAPAEMPRPREDFFRTVSAAELRRELGRADEPRRAGERAPSLRDSAPDILRYSARSAAPAPVPKTESAPPTAPLFAASAAPEWRMVGEVLDTYIVVEQGEKMILIDKHAAHERILYDKLSSQDGGVMMQALLTPETCTPSSAEKQALLEHSEELARLGFEVEDFGGGAVVVRQAPADVDVGEIAALISEIGAALSEGAQLGSARAKLLALVACKAAIKAGRRSAPEELSALIGRVLSGEVKYCPHGRPVAVELTRYRLDKMFGRA